MKTFITGGSGFLGQRLITRLRQEGHEVTVLSRSLKSDANHVVRVSAAAWAAEAAGPAGGLQRRGAVRLGAKAAKELGQRHAGLELDSVEGHRVHSVVGCTQVTRPVAHQMSQAEAAY